MKELSWEYDKILKSRHEVAELPKLHSQLKYWLINEREGNENLNNFIDLSISLEKGIILVNEIEKTEEMLCLCSFNLSDEFTAECLSSIAEQKGVVEINGDTQLNSFFNFLVQTRNQIESNMSTYVIKKQSDLSDLLKDEYFTKTLNNDMKTINFLLLEVRYNLVNHGVLFTESADRAIKDSEDLLKLNLEILGESFQTKDKRDQEEFYKKHLGCEKNLKESISFLKNALKA